MFRLSRSKLPKPFAKKKGVKIYSEHIHAKRLVRMLKAKNSDRMCPAAPNFNPSRSPSDIWLRFRDDDQADPCSVCKSFVLGGEMLLVCPCIALGDSAAIGLTLCRLEEMGMI